MSTKEEKTDGRPSGGQRSSVPGAKILSKKFSNTSRFVVSSQVWMNTIPTRDCDVLMTFPAKTDDHTLMWVLARLRARAPELAVHVRHHSSTGVYGFYLTATYENLLKGAEDLGIKKELKPEYGGGMQTFVFEDSDFYLGVEDQVAFLTSQERQSIVKNMLYNLRAIEGDQLNKIRFREGQAIVPFLESKGVIKQVLPLHVSEDLHFLRKSWVQAIFSYQPLDKISEYFGIKIAMYFAYLGHYTRALLIPATIGIFFWFGAKKSQEMDDLLFVAFAFINIVWATLYLEHWKRRSAEFAYGWGTLDKEDELLVEPRPLFTGIAMKSQVTGRDEPYYPAWKRNIFRYCVSLPVIAICLSVVFATMWGIFRIQDWVNAQVKLGEFPSVVKFAPKILLAVCIGIMDDIYKKIAYWLNDTENYRLEEEYENHLIIKLVLFQFVNSFLSLFYIAFYLQDMDRLQDQLAALLITKQVIGNIKEALLPYVIEKAKLFKIGYEMTGAMSPTTIEKTAKEMTEGKNGNAESTANMGIEEIQENLAKESQENVSEADNQDVGIKKEDIEIRKSGPTLTQAEVEGGMKVYEDTLEDYLEMLIQFGYVVLFSSAFPMAAVCALLNNVIEIRSDAFKLVYSMQRPFGQRVKDIGTWQDALEFMSVIAVIVNCALIGMSGLVDRLFPSWGTPEKICLIVLLEHIILALKFAVAYAIPDVPHWVATEQARLEFLRREALKKLETKPVAQPSSPQGGSGDSTQNPLSKVSLEQNMRQRNIAQPQSSQQEKIVTSTGQYRSSSGMRHKEL